MDNLILYSVYGIIFFCGVCLGVILNFFTIRRIITKSPEGLILWKKVIELKGEKTNETIS